MEDINKKATKYLNNLRRTQYIPNNVHNLKEYILLCPYEVDVFYSNKDAIITRGLGVLDHKEKDLLSFIEIQDALNLEYIETKVLMPRTYAESLTPIPCHISVQVVVLSRVTEDGKSQILNMIDSTSYNRTYYDKIWVEYNDPHTTLLPGQVVIIMNRRTGGWDGSYKQPVIELLGGGGHLPTIWDNNTSSFKPMKLIDVAVKEINEELRYLVSSKEVTIIGGFHNETSNELVVLCGVFIPFSSILQIQKRALGNIQENTDGIYLGRFTEIMKLYLENANPYAGGEKTKSSNFPSQAELMKLVFQKLSI